MAYAKNLKLQRGIDNHFKIKLRNRDQKVVNVAGSTFEMTVTDPATSQETIRVNMQIQDGIGGIVKGTITEAQMALMHTDFYHYGIKMIDAEGEVWPVYVDDNFNAAGNIQVCDDAYPIPTPTNTITVAAGDTKTNTVNLQERTGRGLQTAAFYTTGYTGTITVQGHLSDSTSVDDDDFVDITTVSFSNDTGIKYTVWSGMFKGVRFVFDTASGTVDQILHRY
jgi:hypothetical protein